MSIFQALRFFCNMACVIAIAVIVFWIAVVIRSIAICQPFAYNWNRTIGGTCGDRPLAYLLTAVFNMILDLSIISAPMPQLWQLQVSTSKKWILTGIFSLGLAWVSVVLIHGARSCSNWQEILQQGLRHDDLAYNLCCPVQRQYLRQNILCCGRLALEHTRIDHWYNYSIFASVTPRARPSGSKQDV